METQVLLVEDNADLAGSLADYLSEVGFAVDFAFNGQSCLELLKQNQYDVIIMDVMMPILDGLSTCAALRNDLGINTPVLFLTARDSLDDKVEGFKSGGDDYLVKPFASEELVCRLNALVKRRNAESIEPQQFGELTIDQQLQQVYRQGQLINLHEIQFKILMSLINAAPMIVTRIELEDQLWPEGLPESDPLRSHIYRLRQQLDKPFTVPLIKTVHRKGYRLAIPY